MGVTRVDQLSDTEKARFNEWADRWIEIGLRTGPADRARFEAAVADCYRFANIPFPDVVVWVPSPLVLAFAAPTAAVAIELIGAERRGTLTPGTAKRAVRDAVHDAVDDAVHGAVHDAVHDAVHGAVRGAVDDAVDDAVGDAVHGAVRGAVRGAVGDAVHGAVDDAVDGAVDGAVHDAVRDAVHDAVHGAVHGAVRQAIDSSWYRIFAGQFWAGGAWYWGGAWTSYFREVCKLELPGDLWDRGRAYEATMESACWWWPHRRFVMVCERPVAIHRELTNPDVERGWGSHRLHCEDGPAVVWPDGWGVYSWHGVRVPADLIENPDGITAARILAEENAEVRRVMIERATPERFLLEANAEPVQQDDYGKLWRIDLAGDEPLVMVELLNATLEPDQSRKTYFLRVPPDSTTARGAAAWTFDVPESEYVLAAES